MERTTGKLTQIRYVTQHYTDLQGLRIVPYGAAMLAAALVCAVQPSATWALTAATWIGIASHWLIGAYYQRTFGSVQPTDPLTLGQRVAVGVGMVLGVALLFFAVHSPRLLLGLWGLGCSTALVLRYGRSGGLRLRAHWMVIALLFAALGVFLLAPIPGLEPPLRPDLWSTPTLLAVVLIPMSFALMIGGLLDHLLLLGTLQAAPEERHGETV